MYRSTYNQPPDSDCENPIQHHHNFLSKNETNADEAALNNLSHQRHSTTHQNIEVVLYQTKDELWVESISSFVRLKSPQASK
jgi:hypothetical protein